MAKDKKNGKRGGRVWALLIVAGLALFVALNYEDLYHRWLISRTTVEIPSSFTMPIRIERGLIVVNASTGGRDLEMILDSAAFETRITAATAVELGITARLQDDVGDTFGRRADMGIASVSQFRMSEGAESVVWNDTTAGILLWGAGALTPCVAPDGIIGGTLMRHSSWVIDYEAGLVHIGARDDLPDAALAASSPQAWTSVDMRTDGIALEPRVSVTVDGREVSNVLVDTGSNGGLTLPRDLVDELAIPTEDRVVVDDRATAGIFGTTEVSAVIAPVDLRIGDLGPLRVWATFTDDSAAKLGNEVLQHFVIGIVPGEGRLYLRPTGEPAAGGSLSEDAEAATGAAGVRNVSRASDEATGAPLRHGFIPGIADDADEWVVVYRERAWNEVFASDGQGRLDAQDPLAVGTRLSHINGQRPSEVFSSRCDWFLGVRTFINETELELRTADGTVLRIDGRSRLRSAES